MSNPLSAVLAESALLLDQENRADAVLSAQIARKFAAQIVDFQQQPKGPLDAAFQDAMAGSTLPIISAIKAARPWLCWEFSALGGRIRSEVANGMMQTELIGPDGIFYSDSIRLGLWVQSAGLDYPIRSHAAEETFFILSGNAHWTRNGQPPYFAGAGCEIHHPSFVEHSTQTLDQPLFALWRWSGDISIEQYRLKG